MSCIVKTKRGSGLSGSFPHTGSLCRLLLHCGGQQRAEWPRRRQASPLRRRGNAKSNFDIGTYMQFRLLCLLGWAKSTEHTEGTSRAGTHTTMATRRRHSKRCWPRAAALALSLAGGCLSGVAPPSVPPGWTVHFQQDTPYVSWGTMYVQYNDSGFGRHEQQQYDY